MPIQKLEIVEYPSVRKNIETIRHMFNLSKTVNCEPTDEQIITTALTKWALEIEDAKRLNT